MTNQQQNGILAAAATGNSSSPPPSGHNNDENDRPMGLQQQVNETAATTTNGGMAPQQEQHQYGGAHNQFEDHPPQFDVKPPLAPTFPTAMMPICAQCAQPIAQPYLLRVDPDLEFHPACLKCAECQRLLDEHCTTFVHGGKTLCRDDYFRLLSRRCLCQRCKMELPPTEMVMRARQLVFHLDCFSCFACRRTLAPGERIQLHQNELYCQSPDCYMQQQHHQFPPLMNGHHPGGGMPPMMACGPPEFTALQPPPVAAPPALFPSDKPTPLGAGGTPPYELAQLGNGEGANGMGNGNNNTFLPSTFARSGGGGQPPLCSSVVSQLASSGASPLSFSNPEGSLTPSSTNASTPVATINGTAAQMGAQQSGSGGAQAQHGFHQQQQGTSFDAGMGGPGAAGTAHNGGSNCSSSSSSMIVAAVKSKKSKKDKPAQRVRTVLNESQLKILKQTYGHNQRPDTATKEQLVEMTGLSARVIRVWFQNKRCKDKKRQIEQREKQQSQEKDQTMRSVRINGIGPMTAGSPGPVLVDPQQQQQQHLGPQFPAPVEIRQFQQRLLWADGMGGVMDGAPAPLDTPFSHQSATALMMSNGPIPEFLHPSNANFPPLPNGIQLFSQHAISD